MRRLAMLIAALTGRTDRRAREQEAASRAALADAESAMREAREAIAKQARRIANLDRWERLYAQRMADRVDVP